jgi:acyl-CoA dehydrogenase
MVPRNITGEEHEAFRASIRRFIERDIMPRYREFEDNGEVPRDIWLKAGEMGMLAPDVPVEYGGPGGDFIFNAVVHEELARAGAASFSASLIAHGDIVSGYLVDLGTEQQKLEWLPRLVTGEVIAAIGMSEPSAGSDLKALRTTAVRDGDNFVINGQKTFITNGYNADLVIVAAKTDTSGKSSGVSLFLVDSSLPGFQRGRKLEKVGQKAGDTAELFFDNVRVPATAMLGEENRGFRLMMQQLPRERVAIAMTAVAEAESALDWTIDHVKAREAFGQTLSQFQTVRFKIAELATEMALQRVFLDWCIERCVSGELDLQSAVMCKYSASDVSYRVIDECLQLFGGYGYMREYPISRAWVDARIHKIYGGSNEIMKDIIGKGILN